MSIITVFKDWFSRYFSDEEAVILFILLMFMLSIVVLMGKILAPVFASIVIAYLFSGIMLKLEGRGIPHLYAVTAAFLSFLITSIAALFMILPLAGQQLSNFLTELPGMMGRGQEILMLLPQEYPSVISESQVQTWIELASKELALIGQWVVSFSLSNIHNVVSILIYTILVPILVFFFLKDRLLLQRSVSQFLPDQRVLMTQIWHEMNDQIANYVRGKAIEIIIVGSVSYICFVILGLEYAALLAVLIGLSVIIPYIGAAVVTLPILLIGYFQWGWTSEFFTLTVVYFVIQTLDGNVLVPLLFSEVVNLHPVAIILSILVFGGVWGFWGVFFAIPLATLIKAVFSAWPTTLSKQVEIEQLIAKDTEASSHS